jgi:hypothetical protein
MRTEKIKGAQRDILCAPFVCEICLLRRDVTQWLWVMQS